MHLELTRESLEVLRAGKTRSIALAIATVERAGLRLEHKFRFHALAAEDHCAADCIEVEVLAHVQRAYGALRLQIEGIGDMIQGPIADTEPAAVVWLRYAGECGTIRMETAAA